MSWFKRKDSPQIPPVSNDAARNELLGSYSGNSTSPRPPAGSNRTISSANTYVASRDGDLYNSANRAPSSGGSTYTSSRDRYDRNNPVGDVYSRGLRDADADREQLFAGYNPERNRPAQQGSGRWDDDNRERGEDYNEEEDVEAIKKDTRTLKQDSLQSTRNALRLAREAEETARGTLLKLGDQSEKLANTERHLDIAKGHANRAEDRTGELKQLNRSIFRPVVVWNKDAKRAEQEAKMNARHTEERQEHERTMNDIRESQNRVGRAATYGTNSRGGGRDGPPEEDEEGIGGRGSGRYRTAEEQKARKADRKRYQFEATASDDELEDEIDDNLDELADASKRLNAIAIAAGQELDRQNPRIQRISDKTENLDLKIVKNTDKLKRFAR